MASIKTPSKRSFVNPSELGGEVVRKVGSSVAKSTVDEAAESGKTFIEQLLGFNFDAKTKPTKAEKQPPPADNANHFELFNLDKHNAQQADKKKATSEKAAPRIEAHINYHRDIVKSSEKASRSELGEMNRTIKEIQAELRKLLTTSKVVQMEFAQVAVEQTPTTVGKYHVNFFEWMLIVIRQARQKVEDSGAWLNTVKGKGAKKGYWGMAKKHGTTFSMSNERQVATQVG